MKKLAMLVVVLLAQHFCFSQNLTPQVESTAGDFFFSTQGSLSWTLGEVMVETYQSNTGYLTQGFHQPLYIIVTDLAELEKGISAYPVPVRDVLHLKITVGGEYSIELFDLKGVKLTHLEAAVLDTTVEQVIDMREFSSALYLLRIANTTSGKALNYRITKD